MQDYLKIKGVKKIKKEITLENISTVNYLVGINGSGKTSVLDSLALLKDNSNSKNILNDESNIELFIGGKNIIKTIKPFGGIDYSSNVNQLKIVVSASSKNSSLETKTSGVTAYNPDLQELEQSSTSSSVFNTRTINKKNIFDNFNKIIDFFGMEPLVFSVVRENEWDENSKRVFSQEKEKISPSIMSSGLINLYDIHQQIYSIVSNIELVKNSDAIIFIIEEPENNLHPEMQKKIPHFLNKIIEDLSEEIKDKVKFFISTHSPFVLGQISNFSNRQKAYLLKDGMLSDAEENICESSNGIFGGKCAWLVGKILGAEITDLGYPENYCILEEASLEFILKTLSEKEILKNIQFISAGGWTKIEKVIDLTKNLQTATLLVKCNPYYFDKFIIILDNTYHFNKKDKEKIESMKEKIKPQERFIELKNQNIEDYYKNLDKEVYKEYTETPDNKSGEVKRKFSELITEKIKTKEDFSKLFDGELDFLLN